MLSGGMQKASVTLLGGFAAEVDGAPVPDSAWRLRKAKELVKLLALADGHHLHREQAMDALWPDRDLAAAANNLNQAVHAARRALGAEAIELQDGLLRLDADLDVEAFERAANDARRDRTAAACERALALYGGELLPENRYDDWAELERGRLAAIHEELEQMLDELGVVPGRSRLPLETSTFVGREHELAELRTLLGRTRLLTLAGTGGAGKTRLALELARAREDELADGAVLVELDSVAEGADVPDAVAEALDLRALPGRALVDAIAADLAPRELLLVLDNCEHVIDGERRARRRAAALGAAPDDPRDEPRASARPRGGRLPRPVARDPGSGRRRGARGAARLRGGAPLRRARRRGLARLRLDETNAAAVARICHRLDGLPLALELAAARIDALAADALAERLDDRFRLLRAGSRTAPTRQRTLEAALDWSYELLGRRRARPLAPSRGLRRRLHARGGGGGVRGGRARAGARSPTCSRGWWSNRSSRPRSARARARYRLLETIRDYAGARLAEAEELAALSLRHAEWLEGLVERDDSRLLLLDPERGNLRTALETLLAVDPAAALGLWRACGPSGSGASSSPRRGAGSARLSSARPSPRRCRVRALLGQAAVEYRAGSGDRRLGLDHADEALALARRLGEPELEWRAIHFCGGIEIAREDGRAAAVHYEAALSVARDHRLAVPEAVSVYSLGVAAWVAGEVAVAEERFAASVGLFAAVAPDERVPALMNVAQIPLQAQGAPGLRLAFEDTLLPFAEGTPAVAAGYVLLNWGNVARAAADPARARVLLAEALDRFERAGSEGGRVDVWARLANLELTEGNVTEAADLFEQVRSVRARRGDRRGGALALVGLGNAAVAAGDYARAEALLQEAADTFRRAGDRWGLASTLWRTADLEQARGRLDQADALLEQALAVVAETPNRRWQAVTWAHSAEVALLRGEGERARDLLEQALDAFAARGDEQGVEYVRSRLRSLAKRAQTGGK